MDSQTQRSGDLLADLGYLFLGSRLKRLAERLQADAAKIIADAGLPLQPSHMPLLAALDRYGSLTVGQAADILGVSQPAITRTLKGLLALGLVASTADRTDAREKTVSLTKEGRAAMAKTRRRVWATIEPAATRLCQGLSGDLLSQVAGVESRLDHRSLFERATSRLPVEISDYTDDHAQAFYDIGAEWINAAFSMEPADREVLENPRARILDPGGAILFASTKEHGVIGTCALYKTAPGVFEVTKMGVRASARGLKAGEALLHAIIARAKELGAKQLFLLTNKKALAAIHLYEKVGFLHDEELLAKYGARYARAEVAMRYPLTKALSKGKRGRS